jgi:AraC-like DNA-binding protein
MVQLFADGFRIAALLFVMTFGAAVFLFEKRSARKNILLFFLLTTIGYLLAYWELVQSNNLFFHVPFFFSVSLPFAFWLFSKALFDDEFTWNLTFWILSIVTPVSHYIFYQLNGIVTATFYDHFKFVPYLFSVIFIVLVIFEAFRNKDNDLVLSRLKSRNVFVIFSSFLALISVYYFFIEDPLQLPQTFELVQNLIICIFLLLFFSSQFEYINIFPTDSRQDQKERDTANQKRIMEKLLDAFENEKLYATEGLTILQLGQALNEKEYLVRRAINGELGYTNFNSFLNFYRIREACRLIKENPNKELTFQEIAYKTGYQSIATFNRAFKKETALSPGEFAQSF